MKQEPLTGEYLARAQQEKGNTCISVIVPTHRLSPERRIDPLEVERALTQAKAYLHEKFSDEEAAPLIGSLDELYAQIDFKHNAEGLGLFVSRNFRQLVPFYFPVQEKIIVSDAFETRDWIYQVYYSRPYYLLFLTGKDAKLYEGVLNELEEVIDKNFPIAFEEEWEYSRPSRGSSYVGNAFVKEFERDKSQVEELHYERFLQKVDDFLDSYLPEEIPLVVTGAPKDLAYFKKITRHLHTAGELTGDYAALPLSALGDHSWDMMKKFLDQGKQMLVELWREKMGEGRGVSGITACWKAAKEGKAFRLLVERDFSLPAYLMKGDEYHLLLEPPAAAHYELPAAVNTLMEVVINKGGQVIPLDDGALANEGGVALITRY